MALLSLSRDLGKKVDCRLFARIVQELNVKANSEGEKVQEDQEDAIAVLLPFRS